MSEKEIKDVVEEIMADRKKMREELKETIILHNPDALFADGFDDCIAGFDTKGRAIYFADAIVQTLANRDGMSHEEALEFFSFNIECAYVGEFTPIYMWED
jgi:hypothetical protein